MYSQCVYEVHHCEELDGTFLIKLELELVLEVAKMVIYVVVPAEHEPGCPIVVSLEAVEVPVKGSAYLDFAFIHLNWGYRVIGRLGEAFDMWRIDFLKFGSHMKASDSYHLELRNR